MANRMMPKGIENWMAGTFTFASTVKVAAVSGYTYNAAHATLADIASSGGTIVAKSSALTSKSYVGGTFDAADTSVSIGSPGSDRILVLYADPSGTDTNSTNYVIAMFDTGAGLPIPAATTGSVPIAWAGTGIITGA